MVIIYLTRGKPYEILLTVASQNKQFNQSESRNRRAVRRGFALSVSLLPLAQPRSPEARLPWQLLYLSKALPTANKGRVSFDRRARAVK